VIRKKSATRFVQAERTTMRLEPELKAALEKAAIEDKRTATSMMTKILSDWLKDRGYLK
jgi:predicted transcriptional regulator